MKRITLLSSICITVLLLTSCGGFGNSIPTKSDPASGIYFWGKIPGITEEMMVDPKVTVGDIINKIKTPSLNQEELKAADKRLKNALNEYNKLTRNKIKSADVLTALVENGYISGYDKNPGGITLYDQTGRALGIETHIR